MTRINMQTMQEILDDPAAAGVRCVLCFGPGNIVAVYEPFPSTRKRLCITKDQLIGYALCQACNQLPDRIARVEDFLHAQFAVQ